MNEKSIGIGRVIAELRRAESQDFRFRDGRVLGSMCTAPHPIARRAHSIFFETNLGNPGLYPGTLKLEREVIKMLASLLHGHDVTGHIVNGGNEANITALWIARNSRRRKKIILGKSAHFSILKACDLLGLEPVFVGLDSEYKMDIKDVRSRLGGDSDICAVVGVAGTTELGVVDPISELSDLCRKKCVHLHIDAAFGGFVLPFLCDLGWKPPNFDFKCSGVTSMCIDPHKMGLATIPAGGLLLRASEDMNKIAVRTPYLTSEIQTSLSGTRASGAVAGTYAVMKLLGREGYRKMVKMCMGNTEYLQKGIKELGLELVLDPPPMNLIGVKVRKVEKVYIELARKGWMTSTAHNPHCIRLVVMPHMTRKSIDNFVAQFAKTCKKLKEI